MEVSSKHKEKMSAWRKKKYHMLQLVLTEKQMYSDCDKSQGGAKARGLWRSEAPSGGCHREDTG